MMEEAASSEKSSSMTLQAKVSTQFKFFHALSTFIARPELLIPHVRSTDLDWDSVSPELKERNNSYESESVFDLLYSPIYHEGKAVSGLHFGELCGSLHEETISSWAQHDNDVRIELKRFIHHKPLKESKFGWSSSITEFWGKNEFASHFAHGFNSMEYFPKCTVKIVPIVDHSNPLPYAPFPSLIATFSREESLCTVTIKRFSGPLDKDGDDSLEFYANVVVPKIFDWMSENYYPGTPRLTRQRARPLSYVLNSKYWYFYDLIKSGPAEYIKSIWQESTDPVKFIHEDIGIAAYIASLIYDDRSSKFRPDNNTDNVDLLDLGCGNGLLCFFLNQILCRFSKNSRVAGYDIRRRKIWSQILQKVGLGAEEKEAMEQHLNSPAFVVSEECTLELVERSIVPHLMEYLIQTFKRSHKESSKRGLWLIGNHSDELTPWIPVIARRMNATGFFIIPCCPFDFFKKYQRHGNLPGSSIYQNYIEYTCTIGDRFGYQPTLENLRIPSTKKICLIGFDCSRKFASGILESQVKELMNELEKGDSGYSVAKFIPRPAESSKPSPNIDRAAAKPIVDKIFQLLIKHWQKVPAQKWYAGRQDLTFGEIMTSLTVNEREVLKSKGNGLRTLIKSNRPLFCIDRNIVKLRKDIENVSQSSRDKIKTRECYFNSFHPHGCPLSEELCAYKHCINTPK